MTGLPIDLPLFNLAWFLELKILGDSSLFVHYSFSFPLFLYIIIYPGMLSFQRESHPGMNLSTEISKKPQVQLGR